MNWMFSIYSPATLCWASDTYRELKLINAFCGFRARNIILVVTARLMVLVTAVNSVSGTIYRNLASLCWKKPVFCRDFCTSVYLLARLEFQPLKSEHQIVYQTICD